MTDVFFEQKKRKDIHIKNIKKVSNSSYLVLLLHCKVSFPCPYDGLQVSAPHLPNAELQLTSKPSVMSRISLVGPFNQIFSAHWGKCSRSTMTVETTSLCVTQTPDCGNKKKKGRETVIYEALRTLPNVCFGANYNYINIIFRREVWKSGLWVLFSFVYSSATTLSSLPRLLLEARIFSSQFNCQFLPPPSFPLQIYSGIWNEILLHFWLSLNAFIQDEPHGNNFTLRRCQGAKCVNSQAVRSS